MVRKAAGAAILVVMLLMHLAAWLIVQGFNETLQRHRQAIMDQRLASAYRAAESALAYAAWKLSRGDPIPTHYPYSDTFTVTLNASSTDCGDDELLCWTIQTHVSGDQQLSIERSRGFISESQCDSGWWTQQP